MCECACKCEPLKVNPTQRIEGITSLIERQNKQTAAITFEKIKQLTKWNVVDWMKTAIILKYRYLFFERNSYIIDSNRFTDVAHCYCCTYLEGLILLRRSAVFLCWCCLVVDMSVSVCCVPVPGDSELKSINSPSGALLVSLSFTVCCVASRVLTVVSWLVHCNVNIKRSTTHCWRKNVESRCDRLILCM